MTFRYLVILSLFSVLFGQLPTTGIFPTNEPIDKGDRRHLIQGNLGVLYAGSAYEIRFGLGNSRSFAVKFGGSFVSSSDFDDFDFSLQPSISLTLAQRFNWLNHQLITYYSQKAHYYGIASTIGKRFYTGGVIKRMRYETTIEDEENFEYTKSWAINRNLYGILIGFNAKSGFQGEFETGFAGDYNQQIAEGYYYGDEWLEGYYFQLTIGRNFGGDKHFKKPAGKPKTNSTFHSKHAIYLEAFGNGVFASANYEYRLLQPLAFRIGIGFGPLSITAPLMINYLIGNGSHKLELGFGVIGAEEQSFYGDHTRTTFLSTGTIGYRYHPVEGGMIVRIGLTPLIERSSNGNFGEYDIFPSLGMSIGYAIPERGASRAINRIVTGGGRKLKGWDAGISDLLVSYGISPWSYIPESDKLIVLTITTNPVYQKGRFKTSLGLDAGFIKYSKHIIVGGSYADGHYIYYDYETISINGTFGHITLNETIQLSTNLKSRANIGFGYQEFDGENIGFEYGMDLIYKKVHLGITTLTDLIFSKPFSYITLGYTMSFGPK